MKEFEYERIYLHKSMITATNFHKNAVLIKCPMNSDFGIWFPKKFTGSSKYKNYFWVNIKKAEIYQTYRYIGFKPCQIKDIRGITLIKEYQSLKKANSKVFLENNKTDKNIHPIWNPENKKEISENEEEIIVWD